MVQSPSWEANWFARSQEIPHISRNPKVHYRTHKRPPPVSILVQPNPVHIPTSHLHEIHPNIIHPSTPRSPQWSPCLRFPHQDPIHSLPSPIRATPSLQLVIFLYLSLSRNLDNLFYFRIHYPVINFSAFCQNMLLIPSQNALYNPITPAMLATNITAIAPHRLPQYTLPQIVFQSVDSITQLPSQIFTTILKFIFKCWFPFYTLNPRGPG